MQTKLRIGIVEDHPMIRRCLVHDVSQDSDCLVEFDVDSFKGLKVALAEYAPHCILLDMVLKGERHDGKYIARFLSENYPSIKKIMITDYYEVLIEENIKELGIDACIPKSQADGTVLISLIKEVCASNKYVYFEPKQKSLDSFVRIDGIKFSETKIKILKYLFNGYKQIEIADFLDLQEQTINKHVAEIKQKLDAKTTVEIILMAEKNGFI